MTMQNGNSTLSRPADSEDLSNSAPRPIGVDALLQRCGGDRELVASLLEMFPEESRKVLEELEKARAGGDLAGVELHAHTLKSMCRTFDANHAADAAFEIEQAASQGTMATEDLMGSLRLQLARAVKAIAGLPKFL